METAAGLTQYEGLALFIRKGDTSVFEQKRLVGRFPIIPGKLEEELFDSPFLSRAFGAQIAGEMIYEGRKFGFFLVPCQTKEEKEPQEEKNLRLLCTLGMLSLKNAWNAGEAWKIL